MSTSCLQIIHLHFVLVCRNMFHKFKNLFLVQIFCLSIFLVDGHERNAVLTKDLSALLPSGDHMPMVGFGTSGILGLELIRNTLDDALAAGYRLFDTAAMYGNEEAIGMALKELLPKHNLTRQDIFITTKLAAKPESLGKNAYAALETSLQTLNCSYLDLYLIHFPGDATKTYNSQTNYSQIRDESWQHMAKGVKNGLIRNIGVSNYNVKHMTELVNNDHGVKVAVNQVEWHPYYHQDDVLEFCRKNGILLQAYSSLGGTGNQDLVSNVDVKRIAQKLAKHPAQILLRYALQENIAIIPKSLSKKHMESNIDLNFEIPKVDMDVLNNFTQKKKYRRNPDDTI